MPALLPAFLFCTYHIGFALIFKANVPSYFINVQSFDFSMSKKNYLF